MHKQVFAMHNSFGERRIVFEDTFVNIRDILFNIIEIMRNLIVVADWLNQALSDEFASLPEQRSERLSA